MSSPFRLAVAGLAALVACAGPRPAPTPEGSRQPGGTAALKGDPLRPLRLGDAVRPTRNAATLTIDPKSETFTGVMEIEVETAKEQPVVWLNANALTVSRAQAVAGGRTFNARPMANQKDYLELAFDPPLPAGKATLRIEYQGILSSKENDGVFRLKEGNDWYAFTQFEPIDARRAFPCFDEPSFKVPWQVTLRVPTGQKAFSNTPELEQRPEENGWTRVTFAETAPLPSYLIAFAVGPFEVVPAGKSASGTPVRIITPKGQQKKARWAAASTAEILTQLESYFGSPYPYPKLDAIAVPLFGAGAMENPGLVTYNQTRILMTPEQESIQAKRSYAGLTLHELAHQWFGNLVTMAWWDDLWLNEAFATWMTSRIIEGWQPSWGAAESRVQGRSGAMGADSLITARQIRQPILSNHDMQNAFDGITYGKGAAVIAMFERWVGPDTFRKGVQRYLKAHAHGNATAADFLAAISAEAGRDIAPAFATFLDQPGVPLISAELRCEAGKTPTLALAQRRYLPLGSEGDRNRSGTWQIPVCARWGATGTAGGRSCTLLTETTGELPLEGATRCPDWVLPNENGAGYYRTHLGGDLLTRLLRNGGKQLTPPERIGAIGDLAALVRSGEVPYEQALALVPKLAQDSNRHVVQSTVGLVAGLRDNELFPAQLRPSYAQFVRDAFGARASKLGWKPRRGESEDTRILRPQLLSLVADQGEDPKLRAEARSLADAWLANRKSLDPEVIDAVLGVAALDADRARFEKWRAAARTEPDRRDRRRILSAISQIRDLAIAREAMALTLANDFEPRESIQVLWGATGAPETRPLAYAFVKTNFDTLVQRLPRDSAARFPYFGSALCDDAQRADVEAFFKERSPRFTGGPRSLAQALETMQLCARFKKAQSPSVSRFLAERKVEAPAAR
jgi:alanyl aminopeptidase